MKSSIQRSQGFTLIELIVVIVILGVMAAIAGPKFVDLQTDARISVMRGIEASVRSAATLVYSKALIEGKEKSASGDSVTINTGQTIDVAFGYPTADDDGIGAAVDLTGVSGNVVRTLGVYNYLNKASCTITYAASTGVGVAPLVTPALAATDC